MTQLGTPGNEFIQGNFQVTKIVPQNHGFKSELGGLQRFDVYVEVGDSLMAGEQNMTYLYTAYGSYDPDNDFRLSALLRITTQRVEPNSKHNTTRAFVPKTTTDVECTIVCMAIRNSGKSRELCDADSERLDLGSDPEDNLRTWDSDAPVQAPGWGGDSTAPMDDGNSARQRDERLRPPIVTNASEGS